MNTIKQYFKTRFHDLLIKQLKKAVNEEKIDVENKKVDLGLEHIGTAFFTDKDKLVCYLLIKYYGYQFYVKSIAYTIRSMMLEAQQKRYSEYAAQKTAEEAPVIDSPKSTSS